MGRPPAHLIFKRLTSKLVKRVIPQGLKDLREARKLEFKYDLLENGEGPNYQKWADRVVELETLETKYQNILKSQNYLKHVQKHMAPPRRKLDKKGRFQYQYHYLPQTPFRLCGIDIDYDY